MLRAADLFLLTTEPPESFGIVLIEAMACGLPVIATDYPGVRAVVEEGETGLIVPPGDARAVAAAIAELSAAGPAGRAEIGERGGPGRCANGAGRSSSTAWTAPTRRRSRCAAARTPA